MRIRIRTVCGALATATLVGALAGCIPDAGSGRPERTGDGSIPGDIPDAAFAVIVDDIVDGDTLRAHADTSGELGDDTESERIRLIGIDTPELKPEPECGAQAASDRLRQLLPPGSTAWALGDAGERDRYDRALLYLWNTEGTFVNLELVADGSAKTLSVEPNTRYATDLAAAEAASRADERGLWSSCQR